QKFSKPGIRVEADDALGIGHEIRERVHIVVELSSGTVVGDVLDSADLNSRNVHDSLNVVYYAARRLIAFDFESSLGCVDRACPPGKLFSLGVLADITRAEIKAVVARQVDANRVEVLPTEHFHARDDVVARRESFLNQPNRIDAKVQTVFFDRLPQLWRRVQPLYSAA